MTFDLQLKYLSVSLKAYCNYDLPTWPVEPTSSKVTETVNTIRSISPIPHPVSPIGR